MCLIVDLRKIYAKFFRKDYKLFLWIADTREIYVKLFTNCCQISETITNVRKSWKGWGRARASAENGRPRAGARWRKEQQPLPWGSNGQPVPGTRRRTTSAREGGATSQEGPMPGDGSGADRQQKNGGARCGRRKTMRGRRFLFIERHRARHASDPTN
jgi:hypothetical protein